MPTPFSIFNFEKGSHSPTKLPRLNLNLQSSRLNPSGAGITGGLYLLNALRSAENSRGSLKARAQGVAWREGGVGDTLSEGETPNTEAPMINHPTQDVA